MNTKCFIFLLSICAGFFACNNNRAKQNNSGSTPEAAAVKVPSIAAPDSVEFYYYPQAQNQKKFETFMVKDTAFINALTAQLTLPAFETNECPHSIKMYLYKNGDVYKTVYAAVEDRCNYLAFAVNGQPYFVPLSNAVKNVMNSMIKQIR